MKKSTTGKLALRFLTALIRFTLNIIFYIIVVTAIIKAADYVYHFSYQVFGSVAMEEKPGTDVTVQIFRGETTMNIATKLETKLVVTNKYSFMIKTRLKKYDIMPGTYVLNTSMDYDEILAIITDASNSIEKEESLEDAEAGTAGNAGNSGNDTPDGSTDNTDSTDNTGMRNVK